MRPTRLLAAVPLAAALFASAAMAADGYTIGVSNTVQGNGWREQMICAIKAQALASGKVASLNIAHRNTDAAGQLEDIRNLISAGVDAIVVNPADPAGIKDALAEFPDIKVAHEVFTGWQQDQGKQQILDFTATGIPFDGIWTSGIDNVIVDALVESQATLVPVVGADNAGFVGQLLKVEGLKGAAVTNPGSIGGAGVTLALQILDGQKPAGQTVLVQPELWENVTPEGRAKLEAAADPSLSPEWPVSIFIPDWTTYTKEQIVACKGPGES